MRTRLLVVLLIAGLVTGPDNSAIATEDGLTLGVFPRRGAEMTQNMFAPLARGLSEHLGQRVELVTTHDFASFWDHIRARRYQIVHFNQYHYLRSHKDHGYQVIAQNVEFGHATIAGAILVRSDSGIQSLLDLKNKKIVFGGGRRAMMSYITTTYLLREAGLQHGDYFETFALNPTKAVIATYYHQAAAAGAGNHVLKLPALQAEIDVDNIRYLARSKEMSHLPWAVLDTVPEALRDKIKHYLITLDKQPGGKEILSAARLDRLNPANDSDYDLHRQIVKMVLGESL